MTFTSPNGTIFYCFLPPDTNVEVPSIIAISCNAEVQQNRSPKRSQFLRAHADYSWTDACKEFYRYYINTDYKDLRG